MAIHLLEQHVAELIAAGEVVERPASVVKELCENAIDAGSSSVTVEIEKGGTALIRVQDDGSGIEAEDIPLSFLRHATSKVQGKEDLDSIRTLGFRGEALASIGSVARVEMLTKTPQDEFAYSYTVEGGKAGELEAAARPVGTTITVRDLFYNTPARMKFLKKDTSEGAFVTETVTRLALSHPEVAFRLVRDGKEVFATPGDGQLKSAVYAVLGAQFARDLANVQGGEGPYKVSGLITLPRAGRASRAMQFFFLNGRFVKNRTMMAALEQAYRGMALQGKFPGCALFLAMPPELVDVNVHPAKTEVRFAREADVFDAVYRSVKSALTGNEKNHMPFRVGAPTDINAAKAEDTVSASFTAGQNGKAADAGKIFPEERRSANPPFSSGAEGSTKGQIRAYNEMVDTLASTDVFAPYMTKEKTEQTSGWNPGPTVEADREEPVDSINTGTLHAVQASEPPGTVEQTSLETGETGMLSLRLVGEVFRTYILAEMGSTLCLIDKHAAHERMIYEQLAATRGLTGAQQLLAPVAVPLSAAEKNAVMENTDALMAAGIEVEDFGGNEVLVRSMPADVEESDVQGLVVEVAGRLAVNSKDNLNEKTEWVYHSVSCRAAMKAGDKTRPEELLRLAQQILSGAIPPFCPHGRPVVLEITRKELEKQFGRLG